MGFFDRLSAGWTIAMSSFKVLKAKKELVIFPILSGIAILLVAASFFFAIFPFDSWETEKDFSVNSPLYMVLTLAFYFLNYFIVVFFNMALIHCARLYFRGEEVSVRAGLQFSVSRIGTIISWSFFAATVGLLLRTIQENSGLVGKIITGIIGVVWSIATFFVVPVIAYEKVGPLQAVKRSSQLMKAKWGESLGANFNFGLLQFIAMIVVGIPLFLIGNMFDPITGIIMAVAGVFVVFSIISAAQMIFISAIYHNINGDLVKHFDQQMVDNLFSHKEKSGWGN
ncbi:MAG TPA: DUF6159 family protein [Chitinophagaceae bacterium]|jgi:hypothetical protein|nr:DUF6159 family protein [Chitinophagaceae bacterium]